MPLTPIMHQTEFPQLRMAWPTHHLDPPPVTPPPGYTIRLYQPGDEAQFYEIMHLVGWVDWNADKLQFSLSRIIPSGWFMAIQEATDHIVGSAMCLHNYTQRNPFWGDLGWLACDPQHTGQGLGQVLAAAVTTRFINAGYRQFGLYTEHYRLPAIKTYLKLGYVPFIDRAETYELWESVCQTVGWDFTPQQWPRSELL